MTDPPERLWLYTDVYQVMRVSLYGPHARRGSTEYIRADLHYAELERLRQEADPIVDNTGDSLP